MPDQPSKAQLDHLKQGLSAASRVVVEQYLRYKKLTGVGDSKTNIGKRLIEHVEKGRLSFTEAAKAVIDFQEFSNKTVCLYTMNPAKAASVKERLTKVVDSWEKATIVQRPGGPLVSYSIINGDVVHVSFAEPHQKPHADYQAREITTVEVTKVIVLEANLKTGAALIRFDPPELLVPHDGGRYAYFKFYEQRAGAILGGPLTSVDLTPALGALTGSKLFHTPYGQTRTDDGKLSIAAEIDYREMGVYPAIQPEIAVTVKGRYIWLCSQAPNGAILRDVPTEIDGPAGYVRFTKDVLSTEVEYVLGQVTTLP